MTTRTFKTLTRYRPCSDKQKSCEICHFFIRVFCFYPKTAKIKQMCLRPTIEGNGKRFPVNGEYVCDAWQTDIRIWRSLNYNNVEDLVLPELRDNESQESEETQ